MKNMTLAEALTAAVAAYYRPSDTFLMLIPVVKHLQRFVGKTILWMVVFSIVFFAFGFRILPTALLVLTALPWAYGVWLAVQIRRYEQQVEKIVWVCSESTGIAFENDAQFRELVNMYYIELKVQELLGGHE